MSQRVAAIILAAGRGTRMRSDKAKVLHPFLGRPMVVWAGRAAAEAGAERVVVVVGHQADDVRRSMLDEQDRYGLSDLRFATQHDQLGTGDAVRCGLPDVGDADTVVVLCGDTPALTSHTLRGLLDHHGAKAAAVTVATFELADPGRYGRVVRGDDGEIARIVEHADATPDERAIGEVNAGLYAFDAATLRDALRRLSADNAQGELYLTDVVALVREAGQRATTFRLADPVVVTGVNTRAELARLEAVVLARRLDALMADDGVTIEAPDSVWIDADVTVGLDTRIGRGVELRGHTTVGRGCDIHAGCVLTDCTLGDGVTLLPYVVATRAHLGEGATAGPFTHLRPGTELGAAAKVGNFVETKQARLGPGSKANHLSYLGDCDIGRDVNVGAGTITCNYDGVDKHRTVIDDGVFIGSDTQLVAPVRVGRNATVGAGTTVTSDIPEGSLVVSRSPQRVIDGYYERRRKPREDAKRAKKAAAEAARAQPSPPETSST